MIYTYFGNLKMSYEDGTVVTKRFTYTSEKECQYEEVEKLVAAEAASSFDLDLENNRVIVSVVVDSDGCYPKTMWMDVD